MSATSVAWTVAIDDRPNDAAGVLSGFEKGQDRDTVRIDVGGGGRDDQRGRDGGAGHAAVSR